MNGEIGSFGYVVLTAIVGMAVVFFFLVFLSLLMRVIRYLFDPSERHPADTGGGRSANAAHDRPAVSESAAGANSKAGAFTIDEHGLPRWAVAATLAYLSEEERAYSPVASDWTYRIRQSGRAL